MYMVIVKLISKCTKCVREKLATSQTHHQVKLPNYTLNTVSIDIVGAFSTIYVETRFLFIAIDKLTKQVEKLAPPTTKAIKTANFIAKYFFNKMVARTGLLPIMVKFHS